MKKTYVMVMLVLCFFTIASIGFAQETPSTTYDVVVTKVRLASRFLEENGAEGLSEFNDPEGTWVWADTYVFVYDCEAGVIAAHPASERIGEKISEKVDAKGYYYGEDLCDAAYREFGGWVEYYRFSDQADSADPNIAYRRKITYMYRVPGEPYAVGAGIYESNLSVEELNKKLESFTR
jgi:hypothetical protein